MLRQTKMLRWPDNGVAGVRHNPCRCSSARLRATTPINNISRNTFPAVPPLCRCCAKRGRSFNGLRNPRGTNDRPGDNVNLAGSARRTVCLSKLYGTISHWSTVIHNYKHLYRLMGWFGPLDDCVHIWLCRSPTSEN